MNDYELKFKAQNLMIKLDVAASCAIDSLKNELDIFHDTPDGCAVYNQDFPIIAARAEFLRSWIQYHAEALKEAEAAADEILELWNNRYHDK